MELWRGNLDNFTREAGSGAIVGEMIGRFWDHHQAQPSEYEVRSWTNSLAHMADVSRGQKGDIGVLVEYHLPLSGRRIDAMFFGQSADGDSRSVIVELKQWSSVSLEDQFATNVIVNDREFPHPCQQALDYAGFLTEVHSSFVCGDISALPCAYCHNLSDRAAAPLTDERFRELLSASPLFVSDDEDELRRFLAQNVGRGGGMAVMDSVSAGRFKPGKKVLDSLDKVLKEDEKWHLLDTQRIAYNAILAELKRTKAYMGQSAILIRGGPGTGKTVIAVQLLADALRMEKAAAHSTGGKAFTTALRSRFKGADQLFIWNMTLRHAAACSLDLLLVDEAHRIRLTSDHQYTPKSERNRRPQIEELLSASRVSVFLLDENQFVRPDEIGRSELIRDTTKKLGIPLREYQLGTQFRCGGCLEYVDWIDYLLGFSDKAPSKWDDRYQFELVNSASALESLIGEADGSGETARIVAGFCWKWSDVNEDGTLVPDVEIETWRRPWNRKRDSKKQYKPENDPYTLWASTDAGKSEIGCVYSAQGFEFDRVGVIWGPDLVWRKNEWVSIKQSTRDPALRRATDPQRQHLIRNAYRVLMTRGIRATRLLCLDEETASHLRSELEGVVAC